MPDALAAVPVLAQFNANGVFGQNGQQQQGGQQAPQPVGLSPNMQQNRNNRAIFNVPPEQTRDMKVLGVCLAYGKPGPRPVMNYKLVPLTQVTTNPSVAAVLTRYGQGEYSQPAAQAAVWNLVDGRTWQQLAREKGKMVSASTYDPYFTKADIDEAKRLVTAAEADAKKAELPKTSDASDSTGP